MKLTEQERDSFTKVFNKTFIGYCNTLIDMFNEMPEEARFTFLCALARAVNMIIYENYGQDADILHDQMNRFTNIYLKEIEATK